VNLYKRAEPEQGEIFQLENGKKYKCEEFIGECDFVCESCGLYDLDDISFCYLIKCSEDCRVDKTQIYLTEIV